MTWKPLLPFAILSSFFIVCACKKDNPRVPVEILLTSQPAPYQEVNIDIRGIQVKLDADTTRWINLISKAGVYNLLALQNGTATNIASDYVQDGSLKEIRLVLGSGHTVKLNDSVHTLAMPASAKTGLSISISKELDEAQNSFVLDFDAALSVKEENGEYKLWPVLKLN